MKKHIENMAEEILQEYTNCYSEVDQEYLEKMLFKLVSKVKADTVKKMQERLHSTMCDIPTKYCERTDYSLYYRFGDWVDDIAKEILEGGDTK
jgi:hypothetical protein